MKSFLATAVVIASAAAVAQAATFRGPTSQDAGAVLKTNDRGLPVVVRIGFRAPCSDRKLLKAGTVFRSPLDYRTRRRVRDEGSYRFRTQEGERIRAHAWVRGRRVAPRRWRGRYGGSFVVRRNSRVVARCQTGIVSWRASR